MSKARYFSAEYFTDADTNKVLSIEEKVRTKHNYYAKDLTYQLARFNGMLNCYAKSKK